MVRTLTAQCPRCPQEVVSGSWRHARMGSTTQVAPNFEFFDFAFLKTRSKRKDYSCTMRLFVHYHALIVQIRSPQSLAAAQCGHLGRKAFRIQSCNLEQVSNDLQRTGGVVKILHVGTLGDFPAAQNEQPS